jgi:hypothetical protein
MNAEQGEKRNYANNTKVSSERVSPCEMKKNKSGSVSTKLKLSENDKSDV